MTRPKPREVDDELWTVIKPLLPALPPLVGRRESAGGETSRSPGRPGLPRQVHQRYFTRPACTPRPTIPGRAG